MWTPVLMLLLAASACMAAPSAEIQKELKRLYDNCPSNTNQLCICAFNIQTFGKSKMEDPEVVALLVEIINRYDIVFIQEIRDIDEVAIYELLDECNAELDVDDRFEMVMSGRLGRGTSYKEQYSYFYRWNRFIIDDVYQYPNNEIPPDSQDDDTTGFYDLFERPPYNVLFTRTTGGQLQRFGYCGIHVTPGDAPQEIDYLVDVYDELVSVWGETDIIIGGDLNAGCSYVSSSDWDWIRLRTDDRFMWVIGDDANTNVASSECPYDRFVLGGNTLHNAYVEDSGQAYYYDEHLNVDDPDLVSDVSDHYPIEMRVH